VEVLLESIHGCNVQHDGSIPCDADVARLKMPLSAHSVGSRFEVDWSVLLMFKPRRAPLHLQVADVEIVRDIAGQCVVSVESDTAQELVVMAGEFALGDHHDATVGRIKDLPGNERIINALDQDISLGAQTKHGSDLYGLESSSAPSGHFV
jgi:hypothetical protein